MRSSCLSRPRLMRASRARELVVQRQLSGRGVDLGGAVDAALPHHAAAGALEHRLKGVRVLEGGGVSS